MDENISFIRGDTFPFKVKIHSKTTITKEDIDTLFVTCRKIASEVSPILFQKTLDDVEISDNYIHITFKPEDTENLEYEKYCFDVELTLKNGVRKTKFATFTLDNETTIAKKVGVE